MKRAESKKLTVERSLMSLLKRVLIVNISTSRRFYIRIPLKILIILLALGLKFIFGCANRNTQRNLKSPPPKIVVNPVTPIESNLPGQSSPSSISNILDSSESSMSVNRYNISSKSSFSKRSLYSMVKSNSKSSLVNYFTPCYKFAPLDSDVNELSDSASVKSTREDLNETGRDCDSLDSSFSFDPKTQFSSAVNSSDSNSSFQQKDHFNDKSKSNNDSSVHNGSGLPDLINQKGTNAVSTDKARKYLEGLDGAKFNETQVPDSLKKQLEYFDREELLQLISYQKKYLDFKETRIKDLENYIDNLVVKIIETEPLILMNASNVLTKTKNLI